MTELVPGTFSYVAWNCGATEVGPFVRPNEHVRQAVRGLTDVLEGLRRKLELSEMRILSVTFRPPLAGVPGYDVAVLVNGPRPVHRDVLAAAEEIGLGRPVLALSARNVVRFGDTDAVPGEILLNHFIAPDATAATKAWSTAATWYGQRMGVDNSTLLEFEQPSEYSVMNFVRIPGSVHAFLIGQLLRPSFYRHVRRPLAAASARALPVFVRPAST